MNTIVILCDTLRRDHCTPYNHGKPLDECWSPTQPNWVVNTPNIDRLAKMGTVFDNAFCGSTPCLPARRDVYTGRYEFLSRGWGPLNDEDLDLPQQVSGPCDYINRSITKKLQSGSRISYLITDHFHLWENGAGNYHFGYSGCEFIRGHEGDMWNTDPIEFPCPSDAVMTFDERHYRNAFLTRKSEEDWYAPKVFTAASDWLKRNHTHKDFYLHLDCFDPHEPWDPPEKYVKMFDERGYDVDDWLGRAVYKPWRETMTEEQYAHLRARYAASVVFVDTWLGKLWDTMDELDLWKNTMVVFVTDHGTFNGDFDRMGKLQTHEFDANGHIPFIVYHPEFGHGERRDQLVQLVDLYPTVLSAVGRGLSEKGNDISRRDMVKMQQAAVNCEVTGSADDMMTRPGLQDIDGVDLIPVLKDKDHKTRDYAISGQFGKSVTITDGKWVLHQPPVEGNKPLYWYDYCLARFLPYDLGEYINGRREVFGYGCADTEPWLSDKTTDMSEFNNLAKERPDKVLELQKALKDVLVKIKAPSEQLDRLGIRNV